MSCELCKPVEEMGKKNKRYFHSESDAKDRPSPPPSDNGLLPGPSFHAQAQHSSVQGWRPSPYPFQPINYYASGPPIAGNPYGSWTPLQAPHFPPETKLPRMYNALQEPVDRLQGFGYARQTAYSDAERQQFNHGPARAAQTSKVMNFDDNRQNDLDNREALVVERERTYKVQSSQRHVGSSSDADREEGINKNSSGAFQGLAHLPIQPSVVMMDERTARAEKAAKTAYQELLAGGQGVTLWKVTQSVLQVLKADSLESLGLRLHDVPCLRKLLFLEGKVNTYIHCHVAVKRITTLHDLSVEISQHEGVKDFDQLGLGPLPLHPLIVEYFAPPVQYEICKITTADVLQHLSDHMNKNFGKIQVEDFLSFMMKARSLPSPQHLGVRIQSIGIYVSFIRREKKAEEAIASRRASLASSKEFAATQEAQELSITKRVDMFLASTRKEDANDHAHKRFLSSDNDVCAPAKETKQAAAADIKKDSPAFSPIPSNGCPYPSLTEERVRLLAKFPGHLDHESLGSEYAMSNQELGDFIAAWKDICHKYSLSEVITRLFNAFTNETLKKSVKTKKKLAKLFKLYPAIGILNVAVLSMKAGHWDSLYDAFEGAVVDNAYQNKELSMAETSDRIDVVATSASQRASKLLDVTDSNKQAVSIADASASQEAPSVDQVLEEIVRVFCEVCEEEESSSETCRRGSSDEERYCMILKRVTKCEKMLTQRLSLNDFSSLNLGDFSEFIEQHWDVISKEILIIWRSRASRKLWENTFSETCIRNFISQVIMAIGNAEGLSETELLQLFCRQFRVQAVDEWCVHSVKNFVKSLNSEAISNCSIFFSSALLATKARGFQSSGEAGFFRAENKEVTEMQSGNLVGLLGTVTSADAVQCLLKAPMLCNLTQWSQWDSVFKPSLGPFLDWLERCSPIEGLLCLVMCDGSVLRLDGSATVDSFLAAAAKGYGEQAAAQFTSVLALYGGVDRVPQALLKTYASKAIEILVSNCHTVGQKKRKHLVFEKLEVSKRVKHHVSQDMGDFPRLSSDVPVNERQYISSDKYFEAIEFVFNFLFYVPLEISGFAASMIIPALFGIVPNASAAMLDFCVTAEHRMKLYETGLVLGIPEWVSGFRALFYASPLSSYLTAKTVSEATVQNGSQTSLVAACGVNVRENEDMDTFDGDAANKHFLAEGKAASLSIPVVDSLGKNGPNIYVSKCGDVRNSEEMATSKYEKEAREVIAAIRKEEFGMDLDLQREELSLLAKQHARIGRALQCLSRELYSQDSHFVLELVQNADDNQYANDVDPMLVFILQSKRIVVVNNELGFSPANMKALCDVGSSTKSGSGAGYIGNKGIGFKSVFRVTDAPEVHSKGFHVKFDISQGNIGFILPSLIPPVTDRHLIDEVLSTTEKMTGHGKQMWNTCMLLPLKSSIVEGPEIETLSAKLSDIRPSLLLFLHRLRSITVKDDLTGSIRVMQRQDLGDGLVRVLDGGSCATWLVVKQEFDAVVERRGVETTEIALAFPLNEVSAGVYMGCSEHQQVFSFLPLRSYGLKFIIQCDFILPSSREEIDTDCAWNQWLLSEIPNVTVRAVDVLKGLPYFKQNPGKAASLLMSYIPLEGEVQGFFSSLPRMILASLRASQCLPVEGKEGEWALPCVLLGGWNESSRRLLPDVLLKEHLGFCRLHKDVVINPVLASSLGIHMYGLRILIDFMESLCRKKAALKELGPRWVGSWLIALHRCFISESQHVPWFSQSRSEADEYRKLRHLAFIPLANGEYTSIEEGPVWLPWIDAGSANEATVLLEDFPLLYSELRMIHCLLLDPLIIESDNPVPFPAENESPILETENRSLVCLMLHRLGASQVLGHDVITTHIMPSMVSEDFLKKPKSLVLQYLAFVMVHLQSNCKQCKSDRPKILGQLQRNAIVVTNNGYKRAGTEPLHFGINFGCPVDVKRILDGLEVAWTEIDSAYLQAFQGWPEETALSKWRLFFKELGATDFVKMEQVTKKLHDKSVSMWKDLSLEGCGYRDGLDIRDWECPELVKMLRGVCGAKLDLPEKLARCSLLLSAFDLLWEECYSDCVATYWCDRTVTKLERTTTASFILQMRSFAWIQSTSDGKLYNPTQLFHQCFAVQSILGNNAPYATPQIHCTKLVEALGLRSNVDALDVLGLLRIWNQHPLELSLTQMNRLYTFLWNEIVQHKEDVLIFFQNHASVFVPIETNVKPDTPVLGTFYSLRDTCWSDETGCLFLLMKSEIPSAKRPCFRALDSLYPTMRGFFVVECLARENLNFKEYLHVLKILADIFSPHDILEQVLAVLAKWSHDIEMGQVSCTDLCEWKELLQNMDNRVLPTVQDKWVSLHSSMGLVCWCDDEVLGQQFQDCRGISFLHVSSLSGVVQDTKKKRNLRPFLQAMNVPPLSEVVQREPIIYGAQSSKQLSDLLSWSLPYVQRYLCKWHLDHYKLLQQSSFPERLNRFQCFLAEQIFFGYVLPGGLGAGNQRTKCDYLLQGSAFYATEFGNLNSLFLEFSRLFFNGLSNLQLANFLHLITLSAQSGTQESEVETSFLSPQGIDLLPEEEKQWTIQSSNMELLPEEMLTIQTERHPVQHLKSLNFLRNKNTWPPRSWHRSRDKSSYIFQREKIEACEKSLASVMKDIEAKKKTKSVERVQDGSWKMQVSECGRLDGVGPRSSLHPDVSVSAGNEPAMDQMYQEVIVPVTNAGWASQNAHDAGMVYKREVEDLAALPSGNALFNRDNDLEGNTISDQTCVPDSTHFGTFSNREQLSIGQPNERQQTLTGRLGEAVVFNYLLEKHGPNHVTWINAEAERQLPYDIVIDDFDGQQKLVEVKATLSEDKDWFEISDREWELAGKAGERFIIIRVFLVGSLGSARILWLPNPAKLCNDKVIKLALILPKHHSEMSTNLNLRRYKEANAM